MVAVRASLSEVAGRLTLVRRFMVVSLVILVAGAYIIGSYVAAEIKSGVIERTAALTALYVDSFITPHLQELGSSQALSPVHFEHLDGLLTSTSLGRKIVSFKVWDPSGRIVYASDRRLVGRTFPEDRGVRAAVAGSVHSRISDLAGEENSYERGRWGPLLETYAPVLSADGGAVIGVSEFYQDPSDLESEIRASQRRGWLIVGVSTAVMYLLLVGMVKRAGGTIADQHRRLEKLARRNAALAERVRQAAAAKLETDERALARVSRDLHDGPAQDVSLALLRLGSIEEEARAAGYEPDADLDMVRGALQSALREVRHIAGGLQLPELAGLSAAEVVRRAALAHQEKTGDTVALDVEPGLPDVGTPLRIALYRVLQEALNNAHAHAGVDQEVVTLRLDGSGWLQLEVRDAGVGLAAATRGAVAGQSDAPLGLRGMRERVELLGGSLEIRSGEEGGTTVRAMFPLGNGDDDRWR